MNTYILSYTTGDYDSQVDHVFSVEYESKQKLRMDLDLAVINRRHADAMREETSQAIINHRKKMRKRFFSEAPFHSPDQLELDRLHETVSRWVMKSFMLEFGGYSIPSDHHLTRDDIDIYTVEEFLENSKAERKTY